MKAVKTIINILLGIGLMCVFSEGDSFLPNLFGLACFAMLIAVNAPNSLINKIQNNK